MSSAYSELLVSLSVEELRSVGRQLADASGIQCLQLRTICLAATESITILSALQTEEQALDELLHKIDQY